MADQPQARVRLGGIELTIWESKVGGPNTVTISKSYKDNNDTWQTTRNFSSIDLAIIMSLIPRAIQELEQMRPKKASYAT